MARKLQMHQRINDATRCMAPASAGVGFKPVHAQDVLDGKHTITWFEVHAENYMGRGGPPLRLLERLRERFPLSIHGVGLSIGSAWPLDCRHLAGLRRLVDRFQPAFFSEHLAWSTHDGTFLNDLLPLPYNGQTLARVCEHIDDVQETLRVPILLENPSTYVAFQHATMSEIEFLRAVVNRTGCGLLLDVSNVYICSVNHGFDPIAYLDSFPLEHVREIHLAGFSEDRDDPDDPILIDTHDCAVAESVWALYGRIMERRGPIPTLIERDNDLPPFAVLAREAERALGVLNAMRPPAFRRSA
jgi:uncharacterized protein (UPF0276 family)